MFNKVFITFHEDEAAAEAATSPKDFTPEQQIIFNNKMAEQKRTFQKQVDDLQGKLKDASLSVEQTKAVEEELESVRATLRTAEEQATHEKATLTKNHKSELEKLTQDRDTWLKRYTNKAINGELMIVAANPSNDVFNPAQFVQFLRPNTRLVAVKDDEGKETGDFKAMIKLSLPNEKKEMVELELSPADMLKRMSEATELYGNLFKSGATGGVGGKGSDASGSTDNLAMSAKSGDQATYQRERRKQKGFADK